MAFRGSDPESNITEYTLVYEEKKKKKMRKGLPLQGGTQMRDEAAPRRCRPPSFGVQGSGFRVQGSGFRVQGLGFRVQGAGRRV
jgi:hypothetical protein